MTTVVDFPSPGAATSARESLLGDAAGLLDALAAGAVEPRDATATVDGLRARHPDVRIDLLWDREPYDGSVHYDLMIRDARGVTTSLSVAGPADGLPWPLRGAQRVGDTVLVDVDGERLTIGEAVAFLDTLDDELAGIADRLVDACLVRAMLAPRVAAMTADEVVSSVDAYRRLRDLADDDAFDRWKRARSLSDDEVRQTAGAAVVLAGLKHDGIAGDSFGAWIDRRRRESNVRWFWSLGASSSQQGREPAP